MEFRWHRLSCLIGYPCAFREYASAWLFNSKLKCGDAIWGQMIWCTYTGWLQAMQATLRRDFQDEGYVATHFCHCSTMPFLRSIFFQLRLILEALSVAYHWHFLHSNARDQFCSLMICSASSFVSWSLFLVRLFCNWVPWSPAGWHSST